MINSYNFKEKILTTAKERGYSQKKLAELIGVTETTMSRYINGTRQPKIEIIANLATVLQIDVDELLGTKQSENERMKFPQIKRLIARNSKEMTMKEKRQLIDLLLSEEEQA